MVAQTYAPGRAVSVSEIDALLAKSLEIQSKVEFLQHDIDKKIKGLDALLVGCRENGAGSSGFSDAVVKGIDEYKDLLVKILDALVVDKEELKELTERLKSQASDSVVKSLASRCESMNRTVKKVERDVKVSFSRYEYRLKRLKIISSLMQVR